MGASRYETVDIAADHPITARVIGFIDHLRINGFILGSAETKTALSTLTRSNGERNIDCQCLKTLLTSRREEWDRFDGLFEAYWLKRGKLHKRWQTAQSTAKTSARLSHPWRRHLGDNDGVNANLAPKIESEDSGDAAPGAPGRLVASARTTRMKTDFRQFVDPTEIAEAEALAYELARAIRYRLSRRWRIAKKGARLDLRRTIHANLCHGGEPIDLRFKSVPDRPVRIIVFLDVSGSMRHYSRFFLQFIKGMVGGWADTDAYLIHTRLIRVTDAIREKDAMRAMAQLSLMADGFGGGTRIGESLGLFNDRYAKRAINSRTVAMILSDGYDLGPAAEMAAELGRLKKRARRIIWLNPLLGWRDYQPVTAAMTAALPHLDLFAAANTLETLAAIEPELARL